MPFFGSKFFPKKSPVRKIPSQTAPDELEDLVSDQRKIALNLGGQSIIFSNGEWGSESGMHGAVYKSNQKLRKKIQELEEENNLWKIKHEITLNMLTETTAENHLKQREIEKLRKPKK